MTDQPHSPPAVETRALTRRFGEVTAVDAVSFSIAPGETFGLIGTTEGLLDVDVYILTDERIVEQVVLHEPAPALPPASAMQGGTPEADDEDLEPTVWTIALQGYNEAYTIEAPQSVVATEAAIPAGDGSAPADDEGVGVTSEPGDA